MILKDVNEKLEESLKQLEQLTIGNLADNEGETNVFIENVSKLEKFAKTIKELREAMK